MAVENKDESLLSPKAPLHVDHAHNFIFAYIFLCIIAILLALVYTSQHKKVTDLQQQVKTEQSQINKLQDENNKLKEAQTTVISPDYTKGVYFSGIVTTDGCNNSTAPIGDVGCSIVVDSNKDVQVLHGNMAPSHPWGQYSSLSAISVGKSVSVYAHQLAQNQYTLEGSANFYVKAAN
ncbi:MAG: hypothetical protein ACHQT9_02670 [Candidatus Saccharimonadales bacterium]